MEEDDTMILENIDEFINDENKIVTYQLLSLTLNLHVNRSKGLLEEYLQNSKNELEVIYFVGGMKTVDSTSVFEYKLARQNSLAKVKGEFDEVTTCHIYSISKTKIKDACMLRNADLEIVEQSIDHINDYSGIQCKQDVKRKTIQPAPIKEHIVAHEVKPKKENTKAANKESPALSFFGSKNSKVSTKKTEDKKEDKKQTELKEKPNKVKSSIADSFGRQKERNHESKGDVKNTQSQAKVNEKIVLENKEEKVKQKTENKEEEQNKKTEMKNKEETSVSKSMKRKAEIEDGESDDQFETFVVRSKDGNSDKKTSTKEIVKKNIPIEEDEEELVDVVAPTPEPVERSKPKTKRRKKIETSVLSKHKNTPEKEESYDSCKKVANINKSPVKETNDIKAINGIKRRGRRKVLKSKQFVDESGFMVTQKAYESESFSEESDAEMTDEIVKTLSPEKKQQIEVQKGLKEIETKSKACSKKPKQQASLMSFFKKT